MDIRFGFYGKLPGLGDFVSRGWSNDARDGFDRLLQEAVGELLHSGSGREAIANAPDLLLALKPGLVCGDGLTIAMTPSADRVGRQFPLTLGVQWREGAADGINNWPSLDYGRALINCARRCLDAGSSADELCAAIAGLGSPDWFQPSFRGTGEDDTMPRLPKDAKLIRVRGPLAPMAPVLTALCKSLNGASELLGFVLDARGEVQHCVIGRRLLSGAPLAALFDGGWPSRGWLPYGDASEQPKGESPPAVTVDDDVTLPRGKPFDAGREGRDSDPNNM